MGTVAVVVKGVICGKTIELEREPGLPDGQEVKVTVEPIERSSKVQGDGIRRSAGGWADDTEGLDQFLEWNRQQRSVSRREFEP